MIETWHEDRNFRNENYSGQKLMQTEFDACTFLNCDFSDSDFSDSDFINCTFINCNLTMTKMAGTGMKNVHFSGCKLIGVNFEVCSNFLFAVNFEKCTLDYSVFTGKKMKKSLFAACLLREVDFSEADLSQADFQNSDLSDSIFHRTNLEKANFITAINYTIDPEENRVRKAKFSADGLSGLLRKYDLEIE